MTRHAAGPGAAPPAGRAAAALVGRAGELARLRERLARAAAGHPCVALVTGPEGIGKTALLDALAREAGGPRAVWAGGDELETRLPFAAAEQLAHRLGDPDAAAALARGPDVPAAGAELLRLLAAATAEGPLLLVLDDAQWADGPSLAALTYAMRRTYADPVMLAVACRDDAVERLPGGLRRLAREDRGLELALEGLRAHALAELAARAGGELPSPRAAARLREHTGGNPRHAAALLSELEPGALDRADLPLPAPRDAREPVLARLAGLSSEARALAAAAAVLGPRAPLRAAARMAGLDDPLPALQEAIDAGLLALVDRPGGQELAFPGPLARGAVYHDLGPVRRAALHAAASGLISGDAALAHRAAAALVPDAALAEELAEAARREAVRAPATAGARMIAAARAEPDPARAGRRLLVAVELLLDGGEVGQAAALAPKLAAGPDGPERAAVLGRLALVRGRADEAETLLADAWSRAAGPARSGAALRLAELACALGRGAAAREWAGRARADAAGTAGLEGRALALLALGHGLDGAVEEGLRLLPAGPEAGPEALAARGILRVAAGDATAALGDLQRAAGAGPGGPGLPLRLAALAALALAERRLGRWDEALARAELGVALARDAGQRWLLGVLEATLGALLAARGDEAAEEHLAAARALARESGLGTAVAAAAWATAEAGAARGDPERTLEELAAVLDGAARAGPSPPGAAGRGALAAEALAALGRVEDADRLLGELDRDPPADPAARAALARARGAVDAARGRPSAAFARARDLLAGRAAPLELARLDEAEGRALRRSGDLRAAAERLEAARAAYARLGARPAVGRCARELAACGPAGRGSRARERPLTAQERAVADLVARGLTNRAVAERLVVSVKTVEFHLANAFAKMGVRSRTQLAVALMRDRDPGSA